MAESPQQVIVQEWPSVSMSMKIEQKGQPDILYNYEGNVPQEIMDQYQQIVGNGLARVSLGVPMDLKVFGSGAGAHVSVSLTCNQDAQTIGVAHGLCIQSVLHFLKQDLAAALAEFEQLVAMRKAQNNGAVFPGGGPG
jgi:hypothetical protein